MQPQPSTLSIAAGTMWNSMYASDDDNGNDWIMQQSQPPAPSIGTTGMNNDVPIHPRPQKICPMHQSSPPSIEFENLRKQFPSLSKISPDILNCGKHVVKGMDLDLQLFRGMIRESIK